MPRYPNAWGTVEGNEATPSQVTQFDGGGERRGAVWMVGRGGSVILGAVGKEKVGNGGNVLGN